MHPPHAAQRHPATSQVSALRILGRSTMEDGSAGEVATGKGFIRVPREVIQRLRAVHLVQGAELERLRADAGHVRLLRDRRRELLRLLDEAHDRQAQVKDEAIAVTDDVMRQHEIVVGLRDEIEELRRRCESHRNPVVDAPTDARARGISKRSVVLHFAFTLAGTGLSLLSTGEATFLLDPMRSRAAQFLGVADAGCASLCCETGQAEGSQSPFPGSIFMWFLQGPLHVLLTRAQLLAHPGRQRPASGA